MQFFKFLSTLPARGATSNHLYRTLQKGDFYPRSPRGERPKLARLGNSLKTFLSTLPARGATISERATEVYNLISIHAPREGSDTFTFLVFLAVLVFLSTLPARGATMAPDFR